MSGLFGSSVLPEASSLFGSASPTTPPSVATVMPALLAILVVLVVVTVATHWRHAVGSISIPAGVPVLPGGIPLLGHCIPALRNVHRLHEWLLEVTQQMGEGRTFAFSLPLLPTSFMVTDPVCLEHVLKRRADNYIKANYFYQNFGPILGHGIFTSDGEQWYWQRKLATNIFSVKSFKLYIDTVFGEKMNLLTSVVGAAAASGETIDMHQLMYAFTMDSFGQIGFGVDPCCLRATGKVPFAAAFDNAQVIVNGRFWLPAWPVVEVLNGQSRVLSRNVAVIQAFALDIIQRRRQQLAAEHAHTKTDTAAGRQRDQGPVLQLSDSNNNNCSSGSSSSGASPAAAGGVSDDVVEPARDLLSLFMSAKGPNGKPLSTQQLIDTVINFIIAGRDTTAQALSWTFYLLLQHPEVEAKLLQEIREVLGPQAVAGSNSNNQEGAAAAAAGEGGPDSNNSSSASAGGPSCSSGGGVLRPNYDQLRRLRYARAVFLEALRLYPSVPENAKYSIERDVLPDGTVVPAGAQVIYSAYVVNRLERYWGPDAAAFKPERWMDMDKAPTPYNYLTFNAGPRLCLGQRLAELEGVFVLTSLLARFRFRQAVPGTTVSYTLSATMPMQQGLMVVAEPRT